MNEIMNVSQQTPIEIALGIDEEGRTTARKLYEFLELNVSNYSRWCRKNILNNQFAEENVDYWPFVLNDERKNARSPRMANEKYQPNPTVDYLLTATFAKKLAMISGGTKGEAARDYFIGTEKALKRVVAAQQLAEIDQLKIQTFNLTSANKELMEQMQMLRRRQNEMEQRLSGGFSDKDRAAMAECFSHMAKLLTETAASTKRSQQPKTPACDPPLSADQLECVRSTIRRMAEDCLKQLDVSQFKISSYQVSARQMIRADIHKAIREQVGVRHTQARQSQYREVLWVVDHYKLNDRLVQRIYYQTNPRGI